MTNSSNFKEQLDLFNDNFEDDIVPVAPQKTPSDEDIFNKIQQTIGESKNFRILRRIPITLNDITLPYTLAPVVGDEKTIIILDTETTGLDKANDKIIELGLVKVQFSPSKKRLTSITDILSLYEDPGFSIDPKITKLTGITNDMVKDQHFNEKQIDEFFKDVFLIIAHNAQFDRPFFEKRFTNYQNESWACSLVSIPWFEMGFSHQNLETLLIQTGYFFEAHRASIDCLALTWLLHSKPQAFEFLLDATNKNTVIIRAFGAPFEVKEQLKTRGYHWNNGTNANKHWWIEVDEENYQEEENFLNQLYPNAIEKAGIFKIDSTKRFK